MGIQELKGRNFPNGKKETNIEEVFPALGFELPNLDKGSNTLDEI